jgi:DNA (cytosine-5)-methyltransferase 1
VKPLLLDLFCGAGGAAMGYHRAGFDVVGVDVKPQPRYPFKFVQTDAITYPLDGFDAIHASPPCQDHSPLSAVAGDHGTGWMLDETRARLMAQPAPWVIENVGAADMRSDFLLCGAMFGLRTYRHRQFELDPRMPVLLAPPSHPRHRALTATKNRRQRWADGWNVSVTGDVGVYLGPEAMGIDWMNGNELSQAIPPAYTEYIGAQLLDALTAISPAP